MSIQDLGSLGELVGAIGVVLSLLYLARQIRQNTQATRASSYEDVAQGVRAFMALIAENEGLAEIYVRGAAKLADLTPREQARFGMLLAHYFANFDMAVDLYRRRMIDEKAMIPYTRFTRTLLDAAGVAEWWKTSQHFFSDDLLAQLATAPGGRQPKPTPSDGQGAAEPGT
jgi:hypothetical protein